MLFIMFVTGVAFGIFGVVMAQEAYIAWQLRKERKAADLLEEARATLLEEGWIYAPRKWAPLNLD